jgi:integrase
MCGAWLEREDDLPAHPLQTRRLPKLDEKELRPLSEEEDRKLLGSYDDNNPTECRLKAIFLLMLDTGVRLSDLTGLQLADVDLDNGILPITGRRNARRLSLVQTTLDDRAARVEQVGRAAAPVRRTARTGRRRGKPTPARGRALRQDLDRQPADPRGIGRQLDLDHLAVPDREPKHHPRSAAGGPYRARHTIDQRQPRGLISRSA